MSASRKGLRRYGMGGYVVQGPAGGFFIDRERHRGGHGANFRLRPQHIPKPFYSQEFRRLMDARRVAEDWAGL